MRKSKKALIGAAGVLLGSTVLSACGAVEYSPALKPCSPNYTAPSKYGRFSAQQKGRGKAIQWGAYPNAAYTGTNYRVKVYAGGVKVDSKNQDYAPHGSLSAAKALKYSGKKFELAGTVHRGGKLILEFDLRCRIA